jgi:phage/plasmid-like protein (TIGR03299 family)
MSHEIFGNMAIYARKPAWHGLGTVFQDPMTATDAVIAIGADFVYTLEPLVAAVKGTDGKRTPLKIPDKMAIVRERVQEGPAEVMGIVSPDYEIIQNLQFAQALDNLTDKWPLETIGVLKSGKTIFFTLTVGTKQLASSTIEKYFLVTDSKTGKESARFMYTPIRVECQNCLTAALKSSAVQGTLVHRQGVAQEFGFRTDMMSKLIQTESLVDEQFEAMTKAVLTIEQRDVIFQAYWPKPKHVGRMDLVDLIDEDDEELKPLRNMGISAGEEFERLVNRTAIVSSELNQMYEKFNAEYNDHANTAWAAYNVCVEHADFANAGEMSGYAALFGDRVKRKRRAFDATVAMI